jgi:hypothetical protein
MAVLLSNSAFQEVVPIHDFSRFAHAHGEVQFSKLLVGVFKTTTPGKHHGPIEASNVVELRIPEGKSARFKDIKGFREQRVRARRV